VLGWFEQFARVAVLVANWCDISNPPGSFFLFQKNRVDK
jgi:hypothetical protein